MAFTQSTHDLPWDFYWLTLRLQKGSDLYHAHPTNEIDPPYRWGVSHIIRVPFTTYGIAFGRWHATHNSEEQAILAALSGREVSEASELEKIKARQVAAANAKDLDDEWKIFDATGLMR